jgi:phospholipid/cholesterol/gamma-HCH transport system ATP-binding protein
VSDNIALPLREVQQLDESIIRRKVYDVVHEVALDPGKVLDLMIDQLSGGMAKRVAIARALAVDPILILYDEPTTGLDPAVAEQIQDLIDAVHQRQTASGFARTSIAITHDREILYRLGPPRDHAGCGTHFVPGHLRSFRALAKGSTVPRTDA